MDDTTFGIIGIVVILAILVGLFKGAVKTFQRNWIVALILLLVVTPIWAIWAFVEIFTGDINNSTPLPNPVSTGNNQNVNVTLVNKTDDKLNDIPTLSINDQVDVIEGNVTQKSFINLESKVCHYCAETIRKEAIICRFCNRDVE